MRSSTPVSGAHDERVDVVVPVVRTTGLVFEAAGADPHEDRAWPGAWYPRRPAGYDLQVRFR